MGCKQILRAIQSPFSVLPVDLWIMEGTERKLMQTEVIRGQAKITDCLEYRMAGEKGLGVFARREIRASTLLTFAAIRPVTGADAKILRSTEVFHHLFVDRRSYVKGQKFCNLHIAFGSISIVNHSDNPNCYLQWEYDGMRSFVYLIASRNIAEGSEITIFYENVSDYDFAQE